MLRRFVNLVLILTASSSVFAAADDKDFERLAQAAHLLQSYIEMPELLNAPSDRCLLNLPKTTLERMQLEVERQLDLESVRLKAFHQARSVVRAEQELSQKMLDCAQTCTCSSWSHLRGQILGGREGIRHQRFLTEDQRTQRIACVRNLNWFCDSKLEKELRVPTYQ